MKALLGASAAVRTQPFDFRTILSVVLFASLSLFLLVAVQAARAADAPAAAQAAPAVPAHNAAPFWREVRQGDVGVTTIKGAETGVLVQVEGNAWRHLRNGTVTYWGGLLLVLVFGAIALFHGWKGQLRLSAPPVGRKLERFSGPERLVHGFVAGSFVLLAVGGLLMLFGKHVLMPVFGHTVLSLLLQVLKPIHNFLGLAFAVGLLAMIAMWLKDNVWDPIDAQWIRRAGGLLDRSHVPSGRFNFGEKTWFWFGVTILGLTVCVSGFLLDFPAILQKRGDLQLANLVHGIGALFMMLLALGHIYMGTIGVEGAFDSMRTGKVDETWAKEHHEAWYEQLTAKGKQAR
ncbi:MAG: formate dehydrogenase subunit gamma [Rhodocyclaceae bacterium]|nr:formate dehydrogenase subunit gamma [Rhodocyclaceae bacterium]